MWTPYRIAGGLAALAMLAAGMPASAGAAPGPSEKLRRLDIMLMVTALRCRNTPYGFQADYDRFATTHLAELNAAARTLEADLVRQQGQSGGKRALDRISVVIANSYGMGHPTLGCQQLQAEARLLARDDRPGALLAAADRLLVDRAGVSLAAR